MRLRYGNSHFFAGLTLILSSLLTTGVYAAGEIHRNPFARPPIEVLQEQNPALSDEQALEWRPELRAVLVAGGNSVADLGGVILKIGESTNGFRLLSVGEGAATFSRKGESVVISLYEQEFREPK